MNNSGHDLTLIENRSSRPVVPLATPVDAGRIARAKAAYTTRRIPLDRVAGMLTGDVAPRSGDLVLARVTRLRQHPRIELASGRRAKLHVDDEIIVCFGNRYAPDQFEAVVPSKLERCHLVAAGGVAARCLSRNAGIKPPTEITPVGLLVDAEGERINLADHALPRCQPRGTRPFTLAVVGTSMNAGKTTTGCHLIKGMSRSGLKVGGAKLTGTGAGGDYWYMVDSGAQAVVDFTDAGHVATYLATRKQLEDITVTLTSHLQDAGVDAAVLEIADGLFQRETAELLCSSVFRSRIDGIVFAAGDAMGASAGVAWLRERGLPVLAVSGALTAAPLAVREAEQATDLPVLTLADLGDPEITARLAKQLDVRPAAAGAV